MRANVVIDITTPRSLRSPVIDADTKGTMVAVALWGALAIGIAMIPLSWFDWISFGFWGVADIAVLAFVTRVLLSCWRVRRTWRHGTLVEVTVRKSFVAWKAFGAGACTIQLELADGSEVTFDYPQGQEVGASFPALIHDGWILVIFDADTIALERLVSPA